jgi:hypothetical protein
MGRHSFQQCPVPTLLPGLVSKRAQIGGYWQIR